MIKSLVVCSASLAAILFASAREETTSSRALEEQAPGDTVIDAVETSPEEYCTGWDEKNFSSHQDCISDYSRQTLGTDVFDTPGIHECQFEQFLDMMRATPDGPMGMCSAVATSCNLVLSQASVVSLVGMKSQMAKTRTSIQEHVYHANANNKWHSLTSTTATSCAQIYLLETIASALNLAQSQAVAARRNTMELVHNAYRNITETLPLIRHEVTTMRGKFGNERANVQHARQVLQDLASNNNAA